MKANDSNSIFYHSPSKQFSHLPHIEFIVLQGLPIRRLMPIPRREVEPEANSGLPGGRSKVGDHIALAAFPGAGGHSVIGVGRGPKAEPIMVFGG